MKQIRHVVKLITGKRYKGAHRPGAAGLRARRDAESAQLTQILTDVPELAPGTLVNA